MNNLHTHTHTLNAHNEQQDKKNCDCARVYVNKDRTASYSTVSLMPDKLIDDLLPYKPSVNWGEGSTTGDLLDVSLPVFRDRFDIGMLRDRARSNAGASFFFSKVQPLFGRLFSPFWGCLTSTAESLRLGVPPRKKDTASLEGVEEQERVSDDETCPLSHRGSLVLSSWQWDDATITELRDVSEGSIENTRSSFSLSLSLYWSASWPALSNDSPLLSNSDFLSSFSRLRLSQKSSFPSSSTKLPLSLSLHSFRGCLSTAGRVCERFSLRARLLPGEGWYSSSCRWRAFVHGVLWDTGSVRWRQGEPIERWSCDQGVVPKTIGESKSLSKAPCKEKKYVMIPLVLESYAAN